LEAESATLRCSIETIVLRKKDESMILEFFERDNSWRGIQILFSGFGTDTTSSSECKKSVVPLISGIPSMWTAFNSIVTGGLVIGVTARIRF
jgi:hypothetical protein